MTFKLASDVFDDGEPIPKRYTCEGNDISPPLWWEDAPDDTVSLALIVDDPDAPDPNAPQMTWVHWILFNIAPEVVRLPEGAASKNLPPGTREGTNDWHRKGYGGPCPPIGCHRYFHKLYALDSILDVSGHPTKKDLEQVMEGHIIAQTVLVGTYEKTNTSYLSRIKAKVRSYLR